MKLTLYNNFSENNKLDKTISKIVELEGSLLDSTSIINPIITIFFKPEDYECYVVDDNKIYITFNGLKITWDSFIYDYVLSANYAKIDEFNRYYFISDIVSVRTNLWRLSLNCDVLMSYKKPLLELNALIARNEFTYNDLIEDNLVNFKYDKNVIEEEIVNDSTLLYKNSNFNVNADITAHDIVINVITNTSVYGGSYPIVKKTTPPLTQVPSANSSDATVFSTPVAMDKGDLIYLANFIYDDNNLATFINSIILYPFELDCYTALDDPSGVWNIVLGNTPTDVKSLRLKNPIGDIYTIAEFTLKKDNLKFFDFEPYTEIDIFISYLGWRTFNTKDLYNNKVTISYIPNYTDGSASVVVVDCTNNKLLLNENCQLGIKIGISSTNNVEIENQKTANSLNLILGSLTGAVGLVSGNPLAVVGGALSIGGTIGKTVMANAQLYNRASGNVSSSKTGTMLPQKPRIRIVKKEPISYNEDYSKLFGKHGFTKVSDIHLENVASATTLEHNNLKTLLEEGIIL